MNRYRLLASIFKEKNIVILNSRNIKIARPNKFLNYKNLESFKIVRVINNIVYELKLSNRIDSFSIFYL